MMAIRIPRPAPGEHAPYFAGYVAAVPGDDAWPALAAGLEATPRAFAALDDARAMHRYAPGKWSVKEVLGHVTDTERVFAYRVLRFARADATPLPGFDENRWVPAGRFDARPLASLVDEFRAVRAATLALLAGLDADALVRRGPANGFETSVRAIAWMTAGHERHHLAILRERYDIGG